MTEPAVWRHAQGELTIDKPIVVGILNVTPDSFSDGGYFADPRKALEHAKAMVEEGADVIDIGGESTRPLHATPISTEDELGRVMPIVTTLRKELPQLLLSIDTTKSDVAERALAEGVAI